MAKVALIGCGPSGMFFLHALALRRRRLLREGNDAAADALPSVTCFERSSSPGGLWRSDRRAGNGGGAGGGGNMYEALWMNGAKELKEMFDYTFDEHFGRAMPTFLPRALMLEYFQARCTRNDPNIFDDVKFDTSVESVRFDEGAGGFVVRTVGRGGEGASEGLFDKCIWAAGENGLPNVPDAVAGVLKSGGFKGKAMHSSEVGPDFVQLVVGKRILMIGDAYSAEDLTLQAIKLGVKCVDVCSRSGLGITSYTGSWPRDCVTVHEAYVPTAVTDNARGVVLSNENGEKVVLEGIETVIYCTGFTPNMGMLHPSLRPASVGPFFSGYEIPNDWRMPKNPLSEEFGDIPIGNINYPPFVWDDVYRGRLMSNPDMMFFREKFVPLLELDVQAWLLLAQITGDLPLPSMEEMRKFNLATMLEAMGDHHVRKDYDENYSNRCWEVDGDHWTYNMHDERVVHMERMYCDFQFRLLARDMVDTGYPLQIGTYEKLNRRGEALTKMSMAEDYARYELDKESPHAHWRTFRDCDASRFHSVITGTRAVPLRRRWMDLGGHGKDDIVDPASGRSPKKNDRSPTGMPLPGSVLSRIHLRDIFSDKIHSGNCGSPWSGKSGISKLLTLPPMMEVPCQPRGTHSHMMTSPIDHRDVIQTTKRY